MPDSSPKRNGVNQPCTEPTLRLGRLSSSVKQSSLESLLSNLKDFLTERSVQLREEDSNTFVMPRFGADLGDNFKEFFRRSPRGRINSGLLVDWDGAGAFWRNLRDTISPRKLPPLQTTSQPGEVPEIWTKDSQFTRVQAFSIAFHVVVLVLLILPFLPDVLSPALTTTAGVTTNMTDVSLYIPKLTSTAKRQGGGGGQPDHAPAVHGQLPKFSYTQIAKPLVRPPVDPKLAMTPTLLGNPALNPPTISAQNWGNPLSPIFAGDSLGQAPGTGIGPGTGGGSGPGDVGGYGNGTPGAGVDGYSSPTCLYCPSPSFTDEAVKAKYQGIVELVATITADGRATDIRVAKGIGLGLDEKAVEAVRNWRFKPALGPIGKPASVRQVIEVTFHLY